MHFLFNSDSDNNMVELCKKIKKSQEAMKKFTKALSQLETVRVMVPYDCLKPMIEYPVVGRGYDYLLIRNRGKVIFVPESIIFKGKYREVEIEEEYEDALA